MRTHDPSVADALRSIRRAAARLDHLSAYDQADRAAGRWPDSLDLEFEAILALANAGAVAGAERRLLRVAAGRRAAAGPALAGRFASLQARLMKDRALAETGAARRDLARQAARAYAEAAEASGGDAYPAINAASLFALAGAPEDAARLARLALRGARARTEARDVWSFFTEAEALLILGELDAADAASASGAEVADDDMHAIGTARRQLGWLLPALGLSPERIQGPPAPTILTWRVAGAAGVMPADRLLGGLLAAPDAARRMLAVGPLLSVADLTLASQLQQAGIRVELVLPCRLAACRDALGNRHAATFDRVTGAAASLLFVTDEASLDEDAVAALVYLQARGTAALRAAPQAAPVRHLRIGPDGVATLTPDPGDQGPAAVAPGEGQADGRADGVADGGQRVPRALLFGDVGGYSRLDEAAQVRFVEHVIGGFADALGAAGVHPDYAETAGDGIYAVFRSVAEAAVASEALHGVLTPGRLHAAGLPPELRLRLSAHAGPVRPVLDRVTARRRYCGTEIVRTARIEPVTPPGETYVTEQFAAMLAAGAASARWTCAYVGIQDMAKGFGSCRMYALHAIGRR